MGLSSSTHRNEQVRDASLVLAPGLAVLGTAAGDVAARSVSNHADEEERVEPREGAPADTILAIC